MSDVPGAGRLKAEKTYDAAADDFDAEPLAFWDRYGRRTIERLRLEPGANVLDVCCGTGASALPAARAVGPQGRPAYEVWLAAVRRVRPDLYNAFNPWDRITTADAVRRLFADAGVQDVEVAAEEGYQPLRTPEDFWTIALGSGLRWTIDQMGPEVAQSVRQQILEALMAGRIDRVATNVVYGVARAPGGQACVQLFLRP